MNAGMLLLTPDQVPYGMLVYVCAPGTETPETNGDGDLLPPLKLLAGGVPPRPKWYVVDQANNGMPKGGYEYDNFHPSARFTPVETFPVGEAPVRKRFAVFLGGERLKYDNYPEEDVIIAVTTDRQVVSMNPHARNLLQGFKLPEDAVLVETGDFPLDLDFALLGCVGIPKPTMEQRTTLEELGVVFFDHAPFAARFGMSGLIRVVFSFVDYAAVRLPAGWTMHETEAWYFKCPYHIEIRDAGKRPIARIKQKPEESSPVTAWTGTIELV